MPVSFKKPWDPPPYCVVKTVAWLLYIDFRKNFGSGQATKKVIAQIKLIFPWLEKEMETRGFPMDQVRWNNMIHTDLVNYDDLSKKPLAKRSMYAALKCLNMGKLQIPARMILSWYDYACEETPLPTYKVFLGMLGKRSSRMRIGLSISPGNLVQQWESDTHSEEWRVVAYKVFSTEIAALRWKSRISSHLAATSDGHSFDSVGSVSEELAFNAFTQLPDAEDHLVLSSVGILPSSIAKHFDPNIQSDLDSLRAGVVGAINRLFEANQTEAKFAELRNRLKESQATVAHLEAEIAKLRPGSSGVTLEVQDVERFREMVNQALQDTAQSPISTPDQNDIPGTEEHVLLNQGPGGYVISKLCYESDFVLAFRKHEGKVWTAFPTFLKTPIIVAHTLLEAQNPHE